MTMLKNNLTTAVNTIGESIVKSVHSHLSFFKRNQRIELLSNGEVGYLIRGTISVHQKDGELLTVILQAPVIIGLTQMRNENKFHYLRCDTDCEISIIDSDNATELFNKHNLWAYAFDILTYYIGLYFNRDLLITHPSTKGIIIEHIKSIWVMPYEERMKTSVFTYIMQRNHISRSMIYKQINLLLREGVIEMNRGKLINFINSEDS